MQEKKSSSGFAINWTELVTFLVLVFLLSVTVYCEALLNLVFASGGILVAFILALVLAILFYKIFYSSAGTVLFGIVGGALGILLSFVIFYFVVWSYLRPEMVALATKFLGVI